MTAVLLPVKRFNRSKERLARFLTAPEREELARLMFDDVWAVLQEAMSSPRHTEKEEEDGSHGARNSGQGIGQLFVATAEPYVIERCRESGTPCLEETEQRSHSASVIEASRWAVSLGARSLLSIPIDTPGVTAEEIFALLELGRRHSVVIVPSADGTGTNALLRTPPQAIEPRFGPHSCGLHVEEARKKGFSHLVNPSPGLSQDIDTPEELYDFASNGRPCLSREFARRVVASKQRVVACR
jgi:2-phospho-L-lactate guanylyltransferase